MQCDNCGYIFFQPSKKCTCCSAPYAPAPSSFEVGQENLFTIFEMAPGEGGIPGGMGMGGAGVEDYNFTDDFDTGETEYGVDENVLDLSEAEAEGFGSSSAGGSMGADDFDFDTSGVEDMPTMGDDGSDNFDMNLSDDFSDNEEVSMETLEPEIEADAAVDTEYGDGFESEVEGLGFDSSEGATEEISLDDALEPELDIGDDEPSLELSEEPELDMGDDEPSLELSDEPELVDMGDDEPSLELSDEPELVDMGDDEPSLELSEEPELDMGGEDLDVSDEHDLLEDTMEESAEDEGGIEFDLDSVDLDEPEEEVTYEVPEEETGGEEASIDLDGLELEMEAPEEPEEDDDLTQ